MDRQRRWRYIVAAQRFAHALTPGRERGFVTFADIAATEEMVFDALGITQAEYDEWLDAYLKWNWQRLHPEPASTERIPLSQDLRRGIFDRDEGRCQYCGCLLFFDCFHVDHRLPVIRGGTNDTDNLCASCPDCNLRKHTMTAEEFLARRAAS